MSDSRILTDAFIPELPNRYNGKVRENYDLPDGRRIIIATDRLSAFDLILTAIPFKGAGADAARALLVRANRRYLPQPCAGVSRPQCRDRHRLDILPVEMVVRGYLAGTTSTSVLTKYKNGEREMYGIRLPDGLRDNEKLPQAIITPTSKAFDGGHDEPFRPRRSFRRVC
jgi:phosphoribosylaminoimidazole-succinocarboxamide synthase